MAPARLSRVLNCPNDALGVAGVYVKVEGVPPPTDMEKLSAAAVKLEGVLMSAEVALLASSISPVNRREETVAVLVVSPLVSKAVLPLPEVPPPTPLEVPAMVMVNWPPAPVVTADTGQVPLI